MRCNIEKRRLDMTLEDIEKNVKALEDILEIENMHREYVTWFNSKQWDLMLNCFSETAITEMGLYGVQKGKWEITKLFREVFGKGKQPMGRQIVDQPVINVEGDRAEGCWVVYRYYDAPATPAPATQVVKWEQGRYDCEYVRKDGKWKFSRLQWTTI
jgi:hypothetical protein